jgi:hypothetical protein
MQQTSRKNSIWIAYISGVRQVIDAVKTTEPPLGSDASLILGWVYYFDVVTRFSFRHWRTEQVGTIIEELGFSPCGWSACRFQYLLTQASFSRGVPNISAHAHPVVQLLAKVSDIALYSSEPRYLSIDYQHHLDDLRSGLESVSSRTLSSDASPHEKPDDTELALELTRLSAMIYLERISRNIAGHSAKIDSWIKQALPILAQLDSCTCPFALFIIGCETSRDEDRMIILDLWARIEKRPHLQSLLETRALIQTAWNQQDLADDEELEYVHKINLVLSTRDVVPSLA